MCDICVTAITTEAVMQVMVNLLLSPRSDKHKDKTGDAGTRWSGSRWWVQMWSEVKWRSSWGDEIHGSDNPHEQEHEPDKSRHADRKDLYTCTHEGHQTTIWQWEEKTVSINRGLNELQLVRGWLSAGVLISLIADQQNGVVTPTHTHPHREQQKHETRRNQWIYEPWQ